MKWHANLLYVNNLDDSVKFYSETLALPVLARPAPHMVIIGLENGLLYLHEDPDDAPEWLKAALANKVRGVGITCHIEVPDVNEVRERLVAAGVEISHGPIEAHGQIQLYVYDPSGYNLVFLQSIGG